jgi:hypothetical protein
MYILSKNTGNDTWEPVGYFDTFADAACALEEELKKHDGCAIRIEREDGHEL